MIEMHDITVCGMAVRVILDHATACRMIREAGHEPPRIPAGCNTCTMLLRLRSGEPALAINQTGWAPIATDNEHEVNGCLLLILLDAGTDTDIEAGQALRQIYHTIEEL